MYNVAYIMNDARIGRRYNRSFVRTDGLAVFLLQYGVHCPFSGTCEFMIDSIFLTFIVDNVFNHHGMGASIIGPIALDPARISVTKNKILLRNSDSLKGSHPTVYILIRHLVPASPRSCHSQWYYLIPDPW